MILKHKLERVECKNIVIYKYVYIIKMSHPYPTASRIKGGLSGAVWSCLELSGACLELSGACLELSGSAPDSSRHSDIVWKDFQTWVSRHVPDTVWNSRVWKGGYPPPMCYFLPVKSNIFSLSCDRGRVDNAQPANGTRVKRL